MTLRVASVLSLMLAAACATAPDNGPLADPVAFMRGYTEAWNRHDSVSIARDFYDMGRTIEEQARLLETQFEGLRAQGYVRSDIHQIRACRTGPDAGWAGMTFTRLKSDGTALPPRDRASQYDLRWSDAEGWRITRLSAWDGTQPAPCPAS